jgi:hypothetical protein
VTRSYRKIDYGLRPAKYAERLMIVEALRRLERLSTMRAYRYVGFGSPFFVDFKLLHLTLNIDQMISIEVAATDAKRFEFNRPFACVDLKFGHSNEVLPSLDWTGRNIVWLDYDGRLGSEVLADAQLLASQMIAGSVLLLSVQVDPGQLEGRADRLQTELGAHYPHGTTDNSLGGWGTAQVCHKVIVDEIERTLLAKNHGRRTIEQLRFQQIFNFQYADGVRMLTVGGIFVDGSTASNVQGCAFAEFEYFRDDDVAFVIDTPNLTVAEMSLLDAQLPCDRAVVLAEFLPPGDVDRYHRLYRYLPSYRAVDRSA